MMVIAVGLSSYNIALFHLINHAFYKGLLFLGAGAVIHAVFDNQDFRKYGGLILYLPLTYSVIPLPEGPLPARGGSLCGSVFIIRRGSTG